ncbi:triose-phosphate isomerase [Candidatus Uhrbacteria bacterium]|nr:triose-phosphate isomerase [Candidatus Uhrbacteria bacterium]
MSPLIIANWKMQLSVSESVALAESVRAYDQRTGELVLCPSFLALPAVAEALAGSGVALGAQDCGWSERGPFTGAVSPSDLAAFGCAYVLLGHSERRIHFGETDAMVGQKVAAALRAQLQPVICVGETEQEWRAGQREAVLLRQLTAVCSGVTLVGAQLLVVAYEPVWAIGTGQAATPEDIASTHAYIADVVGELLGISRDARVRVVYGGSVDAENVRSCMAQEHVDGVLIGSASQRADRLQGVWAAVTANA